MFVETGIPLSVKKMWIQDGKGPKSTFFNGCLSLWETVADMVMCLLAYGIQQFEIATIQL